MDSGTDNPLSQPPITPEVTPVSTGPATTSGPFDDRRNPDGQRATPGFERRQFTNSHSDLSQDAAELGVAIDQYKLRNRRRFINYEEMLSIIKSLGYKK